MSLFLEITTGETVYLDITELAKQVLAGGVGLVTMTLEEKKGRSARFKVTAPEAVYVDKKPPDVVKLVVQS